MNLRASIAAISSAPATTALKTEAYFAQSWKNSQGQVINEPMITLKRGFTTLSFGLNKAVAILEAADLIKEFVAQNAEKVAKAEATYHQRMSDGTYGNLKAQGKIKDRVISGDRVQ